MTAFGIERDPEQDVQRMADLVMGAASAWSNDNRPRAGRFIDQVVAESQGRPHERSCVGWAVTSILHERIGLAWEGNWQPADLDRLVARRLPESCRRLLADAVAEQLAQYAPTTLDPQWHPQLEEMDARVWWPPHQSHLEARGRRQDWRRLIEGSVQLIALVWGVPPIESLGPLPGTASGTNASRAEVAPKVLERVRALLAKAESTTFEAEAETFTAAAQKLMARHSIDAALLASTRPASPGGPGASRVGVDNPYDSLKVRLLNEVALANRCRAIWSSELGFATVVGHREDRQAVEMLFTSLLVQATRAMTQHGSRTDRRGRSRTTSFRRAFLAAFATRIGERLQDAADAEVHTVSEELAAGASRGGQELVPLLRERSEAVDAAVDDLFPALATQRAPRITDAEGWNSGTAAADRASMGRGGALEGR